jgi:tRNA pseudouridine38-40 synthase
MPRYRLTLCYDGSCFAGSQIQPNQRTVQGEFERATASLVSTPIRSVFAGRTDRGVHAIGQVAAVQLSTWRASPEALDRAINARLPDDMAASDVVECAESFNPRFDATWREYRYLLAPAIISPFVRRYAWTPRAHIDATAMAEAAGLFVGQHDFATFAGGGDGVPWSDRSTRQQATTRTIVRCECREIMVAPGPMGDNSVPALEFRVAADGFLPRMVRNITGALVEVGQGRRNPEWITELLDAKDRRLGTVVAPAHGLTLWKVGFGGDELENW